MHEADVERRFADHLGSMGWEVSLHNKNHTDVIATHSDGSRLIAEVKGHTKYPGIDADICFGQLLRRMQDLSGAARYAIVIPETVLSAIERVPRPVLERLGIEIWLVPEEGSPYQA